MEDAAKRRERLMAMRTEASQRSGAAPHPVPPLGGPELPDPIFSSSPAEAPTHPPRFDYYTNPTAGFSSAYNLNKRKSSSFPSSGSPSASGPHPRPNVGPRNYTSPNHHSVQQLGQGNYISPHAPPIAHWRSPADFHAPPPWNMQPPSVGPGSWQPTVGSPRGMAQTNRPRSGFTNPSFIRDNSSGPRPSPNPYMNQYTGPRGTGGRGRGFHGQFGRSDYYSKSMVEDPWIELEPIVGNLVEALNLSGTGSSSRSWLPESVRTKETAKPDKIGNKYEKKLSLAEYLDLSFNQTIDET